MSLNELADYIETKFCRESVFESDSTYIEFPDVIRGDHKKYNEHYSTSHVAYVNRNELGVVDFVRICDFKPAFDDNGQLLSFDYSFFIIEDRRNIDLQEIDRMIEHDIALANALLKCSEIDAQTKLLQEIEKL